MCLILFVLRIRSQTGPIGKNPQKEPKKLQQPDRLIS